MAAGAGECPPLRVRRRTTGASRRQRWGRFRACGSRDAPLRDEQFFSQVFIDYGAVAWPGEIDLAPDAMYAQIAGQRDGLQHVG